MLVQVPGVIVMEVVSDDSGTADPNYRRIVAVFNAATSTFTGDSIVPIPSIEAMQGILHHKSPTGGALLLHFS